MLGNVNFLITDKGVLPLKCVCFFSPPGFSDKDLEDVLGGGDYKPDKGRGRSIDMSKHFVLIKKCDCMAMRLIAPFLGSEN